ncbi:MAG: acylphosphatase [Pseudonocardiales bacterium]|nr:acylphosphatase [Pseudonocardiales bacterium]
MTAFVRGDVQGVGFRWWTRARALELGLRGSARNLADGRVEVVMQGGTAACARLLKLLEEQPSSTARPGRVEGVTSLELPLLDLPEGFRER